MRGEKGGEEVRQKDEKRQNDKKRQSYKRDRMT